MAQIVNVDQSEVWNGADGEHWAAHHDRYDAMAQGFDRDLLAAAALTEVSRVLDVGCGSGQTSRSAARRCRRGSVVGIDLSVPMLRRARRLAADDGITNLSFIQGDAQVHPLKPDHFDVAMSRAGVMEFADPVAAFDNIRQAIKPGGRLAFLTHRAGSAFQVVYEAALELAGSLDVATAPGVERFADPTQVGRILSAAGFVEVTSTPVDAVAVIGRNAADAAEFLLDGPLQFIRARLDEPGRDRARTAVRQALEESETADGVRLPAYGWLYTATKPRQRG